MKKPSLETLLKQVGAESLYPEVQTLSSRQKHVLMQQLSGIDLQVLEQERQLLHADSSSFHSIHPFRKIKAGESERALKYGEAALQEGKVGAILVAGGQGTRLGFKGPKGCFPITPVKQKSLFQVFAEKTKGASEKAGHKLPLAIMTSPENDIATRSHFIAHHFFGCSPDQISFFRQGTLPLLDAKGALFLDEKNQIAMGPDGNGTSIQAFFRAGIGADWAKKGIEYITFNPIDNPLADPFDPILVGAHALAAADVTIKCIERTHLNENLGLLVEIKGKPHVVEYSEVPKKEWEGKDPEGRFVYHVGNVSLFCFSFSFLERTISYPLPLHKAHKGGVWKFERFIFDLLPYSAVSQALLYPKEMCFAPLKNLEGIDSVETTKKALVQESRRILEKVTQMPVPPLCQEIDPAFFYPTQRMIAKWQGRQAPNEPYVES